MTIAKHFVLCRYYTNFCTAFLYARVVKITNFRKKLVIVILQLASISFWTLTHLHFTKIYFFGAVLVFLFGGVSLYRCLRTADRIWKFDAIRYTYEKIVHPSVSRRGSIAHD